MTDAVRLLRLANARVHDLEARLARARAERCEAERRVFVECTHDWVVDRGASSHRTERVCAKCNMPPRYYVEPNQLATSGDNRV